MSCHYIFLKDGKKVCRAVNTAEEYKALRSSSMQQATLRQVREGNVTAKSRLIQFNYSCLPNADGTLRQATAVSNSVGMDIDHLDTEELATVTEIILSKKDDLGLLLLERSARGEGLHVVFRRRTDMSQEDNLRWASDELGVEYDKGAKDITRVFFATGNDPEDLLFLSNELFLQEEAAPYIPALKEEIPAPPEGKEPVFEETDDSLNYMGIPYRNIIGKWWELYNDGKEPEKSNRDVLTFELAVNLRHICGFDRELMGRVIPCYDDFPPSQKMKCIDSALAERRTQMPKRIKDVLEVLRTETLRDSSGSEMLAAFDEIQKADELYHYDRLPKLPQGVSDSVDAAGHALAMSTLVAIAPAIGTLATGVKLDVHGKAKGLNLCSFIVGESGSGKGQMDEIIEAWMYELQAQTDVFNEQEKEWAKVDQTVKSGKSPERPTLPSRMLPLNNTVANLGERLENAQGRHSFSYTPEADNVALKWRQSVSDFSVMLRQAYDEARYDREAKSADAARVHIEKLLWNVTMCGTQDALYRVITNYTDGLLSRISIARTPDNTYAPLEDKPAKLTEKHKARIQQIAHLLPFMHGKVELPKLEQQGRKWLEGIRLEAIKNDDRILARQRLRGCVNAQRIICALILPKVAEQLIRKYGLNGAETRLKQNPELWIEMLRKLQNEDMMQLFDLMADYLIDNDLYFFRSRLERAYESRDFQCCVTSGRARKGKNDSIFERLSYEFSYEQAKRQTIAVKGAGVTSNTVNQMLKNWKKQGLITQGGDNIYRKEGI